MTVSDDLKLVFRSLKRHCKQFCELSPDNSAQTTKLSSEFSNSRKMAAHTTDFLRWQCSVGRWAEAKVMHGCVWMPAAREIAGRANRTSGLVLHLGKS